MPIRIPAGLPAIDVLDREGVLVIDEADAMRQDIRPLQIGLLNLMPKKVQTETQFARVIGAGPLQIELTLIRMTTHRPRNTAAEHLEAFYQTFEEIEASGRRFDGLIVTGAPVERLPFEDVAYWEELTRVFDWTRRRVHATLGVCWGGQAMLHHFHRVPKREMPAKLFGIFRHRVTAPATPWLRGMSDSFMVPVSRWTETREADLPEGSGLRVLVASDQIGPCLIEDPANRALYMLNHLEYDSDTLLQEWRRDVEEAAEIAPPANYFPDGDPARAPRNRWRSHAHLFFGNWINQIYQTAPFEAERIGEG